MFYNYIIHFLFGKNSENFSVNQCIPDNEFDIVMMHNVVKI